MEKSYIAEQLFLRNPSWWLLLPWNTYWEILLLPCKLYLCCNFFLIDWCHKCLKNTRDQLLFCGEHFYGFPESYLWKRQKKPHSFHNIHIFLYGSQIFWSFMKFYFVHIVKVCCVLHKTLPTLGNEKEQQQIKFYKKSLGELIFSQRTKNLKMFYFTRPTGRKLKK